MFANILESSVQNMRNFSKERIDKIVKALSDLLTRVYATPSKTDIID